MPTWVYQFDMKFYRFQESYPTQIPVTQIYKKCPILDWSNYKNNILYIACIFREDDKPKPAKVEEFSTSLSSSCFSFPI